MRYMVRKPNGFECYFSRENTGAFGDPVKYARAYAERVNGKVFYENPSPYRFMKDGKTCRGSERWLPL